MALAAMLSVIVFDMANAAIGDKIVRYSASGTDYYVDGTPVVDGECYALVWSPKGSTFAGFNADGTTISPNDRVVLAAALAKDGKCRDTIFQIPAEEYAALDGGEWAVCLVDTRMADGVPAGVHDNAPLRVNRWGVVNNGVKIEPAEASNLKSAKTSTSLRGASGTCAETLSAVPDSVKPPRITGLNVMENGEVWLEVADTVPFLSYTIISGSEPGNLEEDGCSDVVDGRNGAKITIGTAQSANCRFFRVKRAE